MRCHSIIVSLIASGALLLGCDGGRDGGLPPTGDPTAPIGDTAAPVGDAPTPLGPSVTGEVFAPAGGDVGGTIVVACPDFDCEAEHTAHTPAIGVGGRGGYSLGGLRAGTRYAIVAFRDVDGSGEPNDGDYYGAYTGTGDEPALVVAPASGIDVRLRRYGDSNGGTPVTGDALLGTWMGNGSDIVDNGLISVTLQIDAFDRATDQVRGALLISGDYDGYVPVSGFFQAHGALFVSGHNGSALSPVHIDAAVNGAVIRGELVTENFDGSGNHRAYLITLFRD